MPRDLSVSAAEADRPASRLPPPRNAYVELRAFGDVDGFAVVDDQVLPEPGAGEVRVKVEASSVQFTDTMIRRGKYFDLRDRPPLVLGYDLVGLVDAVGPHVDAVAIGDRVADLTMIGGNTRYAIRPAAGLTAVPKDVDAAEATTLVLSWMTAYQALVHSARVRPGQRVLVVGGNGAVGQAAIGLAKILDIDVWVTSSPLHHQRLQDQRARVFTRHGWPEAVRDAGGVDVVIDGVGTRNFGDAFTACRKGGVVVGIGMSQVLARGGGVLGMFVGGLCLLWRHLLPNNKRGTFYSITSMRKAHPSRWKRDLSTLMTWLQAGHVQPVVAERLTLHDVKDAHRRLEAGGLPGKLVLDPWA